jgi:hypothetical protein
VHVLSRWSVRRKQRDLRTALSCWGRVRRAPKMRQCRVPWWPVLLQCHRQHVSWRTVSGV